MKNKVTILLICILSAVLFSACGAGGNLEEERPTEGATERKTVDQIAEVYEIKSVSEPQVMYDKIPMVMVDEKLYSITGKEGSIDGRCGTMDGVITSTVDGTKIPTEDGQSNFGTGCGYQYGLENTIEVNMDNKWIVFEYQSDENTKNGR